MITARAAREMTIENELFYEIVSLNHLMEGIKDAASCGHVCYKFPPDYPNLVFCYWMLEALGYDVKEKTPSSYGGITYFEVSWGA